MHTDLSGNRTHSPRSRKRRNYIKILHTIIHVHIACTNVKLHRLCTIEFSSFYFFLSRNTIFCFEQYQSFQLKTLPLFA